MSQLDEAELEQKLGQLRNVERLQRLLALDKRLRDVPDATLVYVGAANVANTRWCVQKAVLQSRANEIEFFASQLVDRIEYSHRLGLLTRWPKIDKDLLKIGSEITLTDVEKLLQEQKCPTGRLYVPYTDRIGANGTVRERRINPLSEDADWLERDAKLRGIPTVPMDPKEIGMYAQSQVAEQYRTIRWHFPWKEDRFPWKQYVVVGVPDGITDEFVYEFKTTRCSRYVNARAPVAFAQGDLYGALFCRLEKRVQIYAIESKEMCTWQEPVNVNNALDTLQRFATVDAGELPRPPAGWKCGVCDFRRTCPISQSN